MIMTVMIFIKVLRQPVNYIISLIFILVFNDDNDLYSTGDGLEKTAVYHGHSGHSGDGLKLGAVKKVKVALNCDMWPHLAVILANNISYFDHREFLLIIFISYFILS